jgi:hypothetical protein
MGQQRRNGALPAQHRVHADAEIIGTAEKGGFAGKPGRIDMKDMLVVNSESEGPQKSRKTSTRGDDSKGSRVPKQSPLGAGRQPRCPSKVLSRESDEILRDVLGGMLVDRRHSPGR